MKNRFLIMFALTALLIVVVLLAACAGTAEPTPTPLAKLGIKAGLADVIGSTQTTQGQLQLNLDDLAAP
ncbi:MAG: hypothetical protein GY759_21310 [Chloroflexi bacterium]|nr:hypothetical protein [Chloroflexota bacterium]